MTPQESRENFIDAIFTKEEIEYIKKHGLYQDYVDGIVSINTVYKLLREQGI